MKKMLLTIVLAALCLIVSSKAQAQTQANKAIDVTTKGIQIGQKIPDLPSLSKYKGKLIILDFWATRCSPCISMMPKLERLQKQFDSKIQVIPVTYQPDSIIGPFLQKRHTLNLSPFPYINGDRLLHKLFPHKVLPHYVWIREDGTVAAITGMEELSAANIAAMLDSTKLALRQKSDLKITFDKTKPYLIGGNGGDGSSLVFHSLFSTYQPGLTPGITASSYPEKGRRLFIRNGYITNFFYTALGRDDKFFDSKRAIFDVADPKLLRYDAKLSPDEEEWKNRNLFCYELIVPPSLQSQFFDLLQADIKRFFPQYTVSTEMRPAPSIVLVRTSNTDKLSSKTKSTTTRTATSPGSCQIEHGSLDLLVKRLDMVYMHAPVPVINGTGINYPVDLTLSVDFTNLDELNKALQPYDVQFVKKDWPVEFIVFRDTISTDKPSNQK